MNERTKDKTSHAPSEGSFPFKVRDKQTRGRVSNQLFEVDFYPTGFENELQVDNVLGASAK